MTGLWPPATWPDPVRRGVRTFIHAWLGLVVAQLMALGVTDQLARAEVPDLNLVGRILMTTAASAVIAVVSTGWNAAEDSSSVPLKPLLKRPSLKQQEEGR